MDAALIHILGGMPFFFVGDALKQTNVAKAKSPKTSFGHSVYEIPSLDPRESVSKLVTTYMHTGRIIVLKEASLADLYTEIILQPCRDYRGTVVSGFSLSCAPITHLIRDDPIAIHQPDPCHSATAPNNLGGIKWLEADGFGPS